MNLEPLPPEFWTECLHCRTGYYELCTEEHKPSEKDGFFYAQKQHQGEQPTWLTKQSSP